MTDDADVIADLEAQRYQAMLRSDDATLDELCDDELTYTHSDGARDTKVSYLRRVRDGYFDYQWLEHENYRTIVVGDCAVLVGRMTGDVVVNGSLRHLNSAGADRLGPARERVAASRVSAHAVEVRLSVHAIGASTRSKLARAQVRSTNAGRPVSARCPAPG